MTDIFLEDTIDRRRSKENNIFAEIVFATFTEFALTAGNLRL